jgi:hypothetical protein
MPGLDPISLGLSGAQFLGGAAQAIIGGIKAKKSQRQLEGLVDSYQPNSSILDYYNKALSRYNPNPYSSAMYRMQNQQAGRGLTTGLNSLQDRRSALAGLPSLVSGYNDANLKAAAAAEGQQGQALSQLGNAAQMKANEDSKKFDMKYNLLAAKATGNNQIMNSGLQNMFGGLGTASNMYQANQFYGTPRTRRTGLGGVSTGVGYGTDFDNNGNPYGGG